MHNLQEFYSNPGTGKSTRFIPFIINNNLTWCNNFLIIGFEQDHNKNLLEFSKKKQLIFFKNPKINFQSFFIDQYVGPNKKEQSLKFKNELQLFLNQSNAGTNLIIEEIPFILQYFPDLIDYLSKLQYRILTVTGYNDTKKLLLKYIDE